MSKIIFDYKGVHECIDPVLSIQLLNNTMFVFNGYTTYAFPVKEVSAIKIEESCE